MSLQPEKSRLSAAQRNAQLLSEIASGASRQEAGANAEAQLMRLSGDPLRLNRYIEGHDTPLVEASLSYHRLRGLAVWCGWAPPLTRPGSTLHGGNAGEPRTKSRTSIRPEVFTATNQDVDLAIELANEDHPARPGSTEEKELPFVAIWTCASIVVLVLVGMAFVGEFWV